MTRTLVWVKIPKLCHKCPTIYLFSWEREGILTPQTLCKAVIASALSDLISPACTKLDKASMAHLKIAQKYVNYVYFSHKFHTFPVTEGNKIWHIYSSSRPQQESSPTR